MVNRVCGIAISYRRAINLISCVFLCAIIGICFSSCSEEQSDSEIGRLESTLKTVFSWPTSFAQEHADAFGSQQIVVGENPENNTASSTELQQEYSDFLKETFNADNVFAAEYLEMFCDRTFMQWSADAYCTINGISVKPTNIQVDLSSETSRVYSFTVKCSLSNDSENTEKNKITFSGDIQINDEGKINSIKINESPVDTIIQADSE